MVGNFRGVLIFVIFVVDLAVTNFSTHENKFLRWYGIMRVHDDGRGHKHHGSAANTFQYWQAIVATADSVFDTNILLSHAICLCMHIWLSNKDRECLYRLHHCLRSTATPLYWLLSRNLKPRKLILRAFSNVPRTFDPTKITRHTVLVSCPLICYQPIRAIRAGRCFINLLPQSIK